MAVLLRTGAVAAALTLALAACGDGDKKADPDKSAKPSASGQPDGGKPIQTRFLGIGSGVKVDLMALDRVSPKAVVARWRVRNDMDKAYEFGHALTAPWNSSAHDGNGISGTSVVDSKNGTRAFPLSYTSRECMCTRGLPTVKPKTVREMVAVFPAPPADVSHMDVLFPAAPPFLDVQLGQRNAEPLKVDDSSDTVDPNSAKMGEPQVFPITVQVDDATKAQDDDGNDLSVRLSTDVLFALNKADLNEKAQAALTEVAAQIDKSSGAAVKVDGHTDNSGNDAINDPLSNRRAQAVKAALQRLVTRQGVTYQVQGHGSKQPIAKNDNQDGRRVNRRVTVAFPRPKPPAPAPATGAQAPPPPPPADGKLPVLATARSGEPPWHEQKNSWPKQAEVRINELKRDRNGYVSLTWTVRNDDPTALNVWTASQDYSGVYAEASTSAVALVAGDKRHRALRDSKHKLTLGPDMLSTQRGDYMVQTGEEYTLWAMYKLPPEVTAVNVEIPGFAAAANVPVR